MLPTLGLLKLLSRIDHVDVEVENSAGLVALLSVDFPAAAVSRLGIRIHAVCDVVRRAISPLSLSGYSFSKILLKHGNWQSAD